MKIVRNDMKETKFGDIAAGSVFIEEDAVFMKTPEFYEVEEDDCEEKFHYEYNAINLGNGMFNRFSDWDMVRVCNDAHLVVN